MAEKELTQEEIREKIWEQNRAKNYAPSSKGRSAGQGVKLLCIRDYLRQHTDKDHPKNSKQISDYLATLNIKADRKTIYNDILRLQMDFNEPIEYNYKGKGYYIAEPDFEPHELRLMVDSIQSSKFITQTEARTISRKIVRLANEYTKDSLNRVAYVSDRVRSKNDSVVRDADRIHRAIAENRKIGFRYFHYTPNPDKAKQYSKKGDFYMVSPYALLWDNGNYYLYAYTDKKVFRTFRVDRMEAITQPQPEAREGEKEFKASQITSREYKVFQMYHGEPMKVRVRFSNHLADAVIDQFGKDLILVPEGEKHFIALLPVEVNPPFFAWIATFGHAAKILYPDKAIEKMRKFIADVNDMYKDEGEK